MRVYRCVAMLGLVPGLVAATMSPAVAAPAGGHAAVTVVWGTFQAYSPGARAITHDRRLVPVGAKASVVGLTAPHGTKVTLSLRGLVPNRQYGAHVHTRSCGPAPADSGPHYQNVPDPHQPSTDPAYANPDNEIWLDFTTDASGNATTRATVGWTFGRGRAAHSVVVHERHTHTGPGQAGTAGARIACVRADFR